MSLQKDAKRGLTPEMKDIARWEGVEPDKLRRSLLAGRAVIPHNPRRKSTNVCAIGEGLRVKINANVGTSPDLASMKVEMQKAKVAWQYGSDTIMDLSIGGDLKSIRRRLLKDIPLPLGTVPIYEAACRSGGKGRMLDMTEDDLFSVIQDQARQGVDFMTVHCGVTSKTAEVLSARPRTTGVVSRGGAILLKWMAHNGLENPLFDRYDYLLEVAKEHEIVLSLGDGLRPGCTADATDAAQISELLTLGRLVKRAREAGVQCMVEGPGHIPLDQIEFNVRLEKEVCEGAPFYVLGPLVTDVAPGYDHITSAIGGALAAYHGADFLCYVTPSEHLSLPTVDDVRVGVVASKIAAHAADLTRGIDTDWDLYMSKARKSLDWRQMMELCIDRGRAEQIRNREPVHDKAVCSMCGEYCAMRLSDEALKERKASGRKNKKNRSRQSS